MYELQAFLKPVSKYIKTDIPDILIEDITKIDLQIPRKPNSNTLYICTANEYEKIKKDPDDFRRSIFLISGKISAKLRDLIQNKPNCFEISLKPLEAYSLMSERLSEYFKFQTNLFNRMQSDSSFMNCLEKLSKESSLSFFVIDNEKNILYRSLADDFNYSQIKSSKDDNKCGSGIFNYITDKRHLVSDGFSKGKMLIEPCDRFALKRFSFDTSKMLLTVEKIQGEDYGIDLSYVSGNIELLYSVLYKIENSHWTSTDFNIFLENLISGTMHNEQTIEIAASQLEYPLGLATGFIIVNNANISSTEKQCSELSNILGCKNVAPYGKYIVALIDYPTTRTDLREVINVYKLTGFLKRWETYAGATNALSVRSLLRTQYIITEQIMKVGKEIDPNRPTRIYHFNDYGDFLTIKLCFKSYRNLVGHENIFLLGHPSVVDLYREDYNGKQRLLEVLYSYLRNYKDIETTAKELYMHKNTVTRKLNKIKSILNTDLSDGPTCHRMLFSLYFLKYTKAHNLDLDNLLRQNNQEAIKNIKFTEE